MHKAVRLKLTLEIKIIMSLVKQKRKNIAFQWQPNWKILLLVVFFFPITIKLAFWQLDRADEKQQLLDTFQQRVLAQPVTLSELSVNKELRYTNVDLTGKYDTDITLLLDNQVRHGRHGYDVISPFQTISGQWVLVNRGWIETGLDRNILPEIDTMSGQVFIEGYLYRSLGKQIMLGEDLWSATSGLVVIQNSDPVHVSEKLATTFYPYQVRLVKQAPGALETGWPIVSQQPGKHIGYAVQWTAIALVLVILALFANSNFGAVIRDRRMQEDHKVE